MKLDLNKLSLAADAFLTANGANKTVGYKELSAAIAAYLAASQEPAGKWAIDRSTDSPILTYENCNVIQDEQAFHVLDLVRRDAAPVPPVGGSNE